MTQTIHNFIRAGLLGLMVFGIGFTAHAQPGPNVAAPITVEPDPTNPNYHQRKPGHLTVGQTLSVGTTGPTATAFSSSNVKAFVQGMTYTQGLGSLGKSVLEGEQEFIGPTNQYGPTKMFWCPPFLSVAPYSKGCKNLGSADGPAYAEAPTNPLGTVVAGILGIPVAHAQTGGILTTGSGTLDAAGVGSVDGTAVAGDGGTAVAEFLPEERIESRPVVQNFLLDVAGSTRLQTHLIVGKRIGVGVHYPDSQLHVNNGSGRAGVTISTGNTQWSQIYQPYNTAQLRIAHGVSTAPVDIMTFDFTTNSVGIGTTSPQKKLDVRGAAMVGTDGQYILGSQSMGIMYLGDTNHYIRSVSGGGLRLGTYGPNSAKDTINIKEGNGYVGIGQGRTNPQTVLDVGGDATIAGNLRVGYSAPAGQVLTSTGNGWAQWQNPSGVSPTALLQTLTSGNIVYKCNGNGVIASPGNCGILGGSYYGRLLP